jgi:peptidoglycan/LPS O-acetylase OafA/YrhL
VTTATTKTASTTRLSSLDALRGIASFSVVLGHYYLTIPAETRPLLDSSIWLRPLHVIMNGAAAVIIFFVLSGYVLSLPFFRGTQPSYLRYMFKRVCRIYIPFAVMIFLTALLSRILDFHEPLAGLGGWLNEQMPRVTSTALAGHFLMIGTRSDISLNSPIWTLVYEMRVSLIFPLLMILCRDTRLALVAAAIMLLVSTRILVQLGETVPWTVNNFWITVLWTVRVVPYFLLGILLSKHSDNIRRFTHWVSPPNRIALLAASMIIFTIQYRGFMSIRGDVLYDIGAAVVVVLALDMPSIIAVLNRAVLQWLGQLSYSVYLIHTPIIVVMFHAFIGRAPLWFIFVAGIVATLTTAALMHRFVELPAIKLGQRVARAGKLQTTAPPPAEPEPDEAKAA